MAPLAPLPPTPLSEAYPVKLMTWWSCKMCFFFETERGSLARGCSSHYFVVITPWFLSVQCVVHIYHGNSPRTTFTRHKLHTCFKVGINRKILFLIVLCPETCITLKPIMKLLRMMSLVFTEVHVRSSTSWFLEYCHICIKRHKKKQTSCFACFLGAPIPLPSPHHTHIESLQHTSI